MNCGEFQESLAYIIDTGGTLAAGARTVMEAGASEVFAVATHGIFSGKAYETLSNSPLAGILVTDTVPLFTETAPLAFTKYSVPTIVATPPATLI